MAPLEGLNLHAMLESSGIEALLVHDDVLPSLTVRILVAPEQEAEARALISSELPRSEGDPVFPTLG
jgi:hypothetical protein